VDTNTGHFNDILPSQSINIALEKQNLTQQMQICINKLKDTVIQNKHKQLNNTFGNTVPHQA